MDAINDLWALKEEQQHRHVGSGLSFALDCPSHFLTSRTSTGGTLLNRRHLELLGHVLVIVSYWKWEGCKGQARWSST
jgi:hypothetical protein